MRFSRTSASPGPRILALALLLSTAIVSLASADSRTSGETEPLSVPVTNCERDVGTYSWVVACVSANYDPVRGEYFDWRRWTECGRNEGFEYATVVCYYTGDHSSLCGWTEAWTDVYLPWGDVRPCDARAFAVTWG